MNLNSGLPTKAADQEREMTEALLSFAKHAIQNAQAHLTAIEMLDAVQLLKQVERMIDDRQINLSSPSEPGSIQPEVYELDLRDL